MFEEFSGINFGKWVKNRSVNYRRSKFIAKCVTRYSVIDQHKVCPTARSVSERVARLMEKSSAPTHALVHAVSDLRWLKGAGRPPFRRLSIDISHFIAIARSFGYEKLVIRNPA